VTKIGSRLRMQA